MNYLMVIVDKAIDQNIKLNLRSNHIEDPFQFLKLTQLLSNWKSISI
jgi:hypothetical protein